MATETSNMNAQPQQEMPPGMCADCFKGSKLEGTFTGSESKIGAFNTYVAQPDTNKDPSAAVIFLFDAFGWKLPNPKIMSDMIAKRTGFTVYCPDLFHGGGVNPESMTMPETAKEVNSQGIFQKLKMTGKMITIVPWFLSNRPATRIPDCIQFIKVLKNEKGHSSLGAVGYCYGGKLAIHFNGTGDLAASVGCHPSSLSMDDIVAIRAPVSFACAESDMTFGDKMREQSRKILEKKEFETEFILYSNTVHGFAARPNFEIEDVKKGFEGALNQTCAFFSKHLGTAATANKS